MKHAKRWAHLLRTISSWVEDLERWHNQKRRPWQISLSPMYALLCTWSDIAHAVGVGSWFQSQKDALGSGETNLDALEGHHKVVLVIWKWQANSWRIHWCRYGKRSRRLKVYCGDIYLLLQGELSHGSLSCRSIYVALSMTDAKYIAANEAGK